jgi:hypothetical protein
MVPVVYRAEFQTRGVAAPGQFGRPAGPPGASSTGTSSPSATTLTTLASQRQW